MEGIHGSFSGKLFGEARAMLKNLFGETSLEGFLEGLLGGLEGNQGGVWNEI